MLPSLRCGKPGCGSSRRKEGRPLSLPISSVLEQFVISVRRNAQKDTEIAYRSDGQKTRLIIQIEKALVNPKNRRRVLQALTGLPIGSQNELSWWYHHVLIDETIGGKSDRLLREIEALVEAQTDGQPWGIFPWPWPGAAVPAMQSADSGELEW